MADKVLEVEALRAGYGPAEILFGVSLKLARGEVAAHVVAAVRVTKPCPSILPIWT